MAAISVNQGTQTVIQTQLVGGTETPVVRLDTGSGTTSAEFGGTITRVNTIGTLGLGSVVVTTGTLATGTLQNLVSGT